MSMVLGMVSCASGTAALNLASYGDMLVRGRPASEVPERTAEAIVRRIRVSFGRDPQRASARKQATGALLGYVAGLGVGALFGVLRPRAPRASTAVAGVVLGVVAMAAGDLPAIATRATDVRTWGVSGFVADLAPHLAYGLVTAAVFDALASPRPMVRLRAREARAQLRGAWRNARRAVAS